MWIDPERLERDIPLDENAAINAYAREELGLPALPQPDYRQRADDEYPGRESGH